MVILSNILCVLFAIAFIISLVRGKTGKEEIKREYRAERIHETKTASTPLAYRKKFLLTKREYAFYINQLRPILQKSGVFCCCKVRLADLVMPSYTRNRGLYQSRLNKIWAKHIDFVIVDSDMHVLFLIELDDNSHQRADRRDRDDFVDKICAEVGYKIIHTYGETDNILTMLSAIHRLNDVTNLLKPKQYTH